MKIYTRHGDEGETGLYGGQRVSKDALRVEAYGTVDELNAALGWARTQISDPQTDASLLIVQNELFVAGSDLATPEDRDVPRITPEFSMRLENEIDLLETRIPPLKNFILPSGSSGGAALHLARCICRRAERRLVALMRQEAVNPEVERYLNRLSDYLFVPARVVNARAGVPETAWSRATAAQP